jgi:putative peptide zinc metalloprotease protein
MPADGAEIQRPPGTVPTRRRVAFLLQNPRRCRYDDPHRYHCFVETCPTLRPRMAEHHPKLRTDLEFRAESDEKDAALIIKDPVTRRFYRFASVQATVLRLLDGSGTCESIAESAARQHQRMVEASQVGEFCRKLESLLLLDSPACWAKLDALRKRSGRLLGTVLSIKIHAFNPDALLARMDRRFRFCFTPGCHGFIWAAILIALGITVVQTKSLFFSLEALLSLYSIPLIAAVAFAVMTIHEFAHGLALKHYGGKVEEMGLLILYFVPGFYCNVSDAWLLPKRSRIRVTLAGGYVQLFVWALATLGWRLLAQETLLNRICLITIAFAGIQAFFNFNPLIRLDGYYLLSDLLEIPNLRAKAFAFLKRRAKSWLWAADRDASSDRATSLAKRENRIFAVYGVSALIFSGALLILVIGKIGGWLLTHYQMWGLALMVMVGMLAVPSSSDKSEVARPGEDKRSPAGRWLRRRWGLVLVLIIALFVLFLSWELKIPGDFTVLPNKEVVVNPQVDGALKAIHFDEGDRVRNGSIIAELENFDLRNQYEETRGELATRCAELNLLKAGTRPEEIERARRQVATKETELFNAARVEQERRMLSETVAKKEAALENALANYQRSRRLLADGLISRSDADRDRTTYEVQLKELSEAQGQLKMLEERTERDREIKNKELDHARSELKVLQAGSRKEAIDAVAAQVKKLEDKLGILGQQLEQLKITAPIDGVISTPLLRNRIGEYLVKGQAFCNIVSEGIVIVDLPVPEKEISDIRPGFPITMKVRGYPNLSFEAHVMTIAPVAVEKNGERMVTVRGELSNSDGILKSGMTGVGKILCGKHRIGYLVTRRLVRWLRTEFWEYLP